MSDTSDDVEKIRKLIVLDLMMIAFGGIKGRDNKLVFKNLAKKNEHLTFKITDTTVDMHKTFEATPNNTDKKYESLVKFNLDFGSPRRHLDMYENMSTEELVKLLGLKEVDISSAEYAEKSAVPLSRMFSRAERRSKKVARFTSLSQLPLYKFTELDKIGFKIGYIPDENDRYRLPKAILVKDIDTGKYYTMNVPDRNGLEELLTRIGIDGSEFLRDVPSVVPGKLH